MPRRRSTVRRAVATLCLLLSGATGATEITDDAGRRVAVPARAARVLPAGPPAAVLLWAVAPETLIGWPMPPPVPEGRRVPRVTGGAQAAEIAALGAELILDVGTVDARYAAVADAIQAATGVPTVLFDGRLDRTATTIRRVAAITGRDAARLAAAAEATLAAFPPRPAFTRVAYLRGPGPFEALSPGTINAEAVERLGGEVVAPAGMGTWRPAEPSAILALRPDLVLAADPAAAAALPGLRVVAVPATPFGWVEAPPSVNRLGGLAWLAAVLSAREPGEAAAALAGTWRALVSPAPADAPVRP